MINSQSTLVRCPFGGIRNPQSGFTLPEVMISIAIIVVLALGTLCYQYQAIRHSRISEAQIAATRIGQILLEDWKSTGGDPDYDPESLQLGFTSTGTGEFGNYRLALDNQTFYLQLTETDIDEDTVAGVRLLQINVTVKWRRDFASGAVEADDPEVSLTTYVRRDA